MFATVCIISRATGEVVQQEQLPARQVQNPRARLAVTRGGTFAKPLPHGFMLVIARAD